MTVAASPTAPAGWLCVTKGACRSAHESVHSASERKGVAQLLDAPHDLARPVHLAAPPARRAALGAPCTTCRDQLSRAEAPDDGAAHPARLAQPCVVATPVPGGEVGTRHPGRRGDREIPRCREGQCHATVAGAACTNRGEVGPESHRRTLRADAALPVSFRRTASPSSRPTPPGHPAKDRRGCVSLIATHPQQQPTSTSRRHP